MHHHQCAQNNGEHSVCMHSGSEHSDNVCMHSSSGHSDSDEDLEEGEVVLPDLYSRTKAGRCINLQQQGKCTWGPITTILKIM
jgi:hypothetical protein